MGLFNYSLAYDRENETVNIVLSEEGQDNKGKPTSVRKIFPIPVQVIKSLIDPQKDNECEIEEPLIDSNLAEVLDIRLEAEKVMGYQVHQRKKGDSYRVKVKFPASYISRFRKIGITFLGDLIQTPRKELDQHFGSGEMATISRTLRFFGYTVGMNLESWERPKK